MKSQQEWSGTTAKTLFAITILVLTTAPALAWGGKGHSMVARQAVRDMPPALAKLYQNNLEWFARESSFPDRWRNRDKSEAPRHFFDSENFGFGTDLTKVPRAYAEAVKLRNYDQLRTDGVVPWTIGRHYRLLERAFYEKRWNDVLIESAILSHYVADSHVPFHASANYDGQLSVPSQKGIHSRWESALLERSINDADLKTMTPMEIADPVGAAFDTLQESVNQVAPILAMDKDAAAKSGGQYDDAYWTAFTNAARPIAISRLETAGGRLSGFIVAAWRSAGRPILPENFKFETARLPYAANFPERGQPVASPLPDTPETVKADARQGVVTIQVPSKTFKKDTPVNILLPKNYATSGLRYPVVYLLHGASGNNADWNAKSGVAAYVRDLPLIVVIPDGNGNSFYVNSQGGGKWGDYFHKELVPYIDKSYRTIARREGRATAGLSMGGYGSWKLALDNPDDFAACASLSGVMLFGSGSEKGYGTFASNLFGDPDKDKKAQSRYAEVDLKPLLLRQVRRSHYLGPALYFDIGAQDFLLKANEGMEQWLLENAIPYEYAEFDGAHEWPYWDAHIQDALQFLMRQIAAPEAEPVKK